MRSLIEGGAYLNIVPDKFTFTIFLFKGTDSKSRITREIHAVKKTWEFHDNESENIIGESIEGVGLIRGRRLLRFLSQMRRLFKGLRLIQGGAYSSKYAIAIEFKESKCLQLSNPSWIL